MKPSDRYTDRATRIAWSRLGILLSLVLLWIVVTNALVSLHLAPSQKYNRGQWLVWKKWDLLKSQEKTVDWLILGDSTCNSSVIPEVLETKLGGEALNVCTVGNTLPLNDAWMLHYYLKHVGVPQNVIIMHAYDIWTRQLIRQYTARTPVPLADWLTLKPHLPWADILRPGSLYELYAERYLPLMTDSRRIRRMLQIETTPVRIRLDVTDKGFMPVPDPAPGDVVKDARQHIESLSGAPQFIMSPYSESSLEAISELSRTHGFNVYVANSPIYEGLLQDEKFKTHYRQVQETLDAYAGRNDRIHYVLRHPSTHREERMQNADHVLPGEAVIFTERLARAIQAAQNPQRSGMAECLRP